MSKSLATEPVIFRTFRQGGDVIALFPKLPGTNDPRTCESYMHVGQHAACSVALASVARLATEQEAAPLRRELESLGYRLHTVRRMSPTHHKARRAALAR